MAHEEGNLIILISLKNLQNQIFQFQKCENSFLWMSEMEVGFIKRNLGALELDENFEIDKRKF